ncbi:VAMP-associated protein [Punctularia strigosozonata HHB-11173 SS5]|uniref:VAMP-associated protein n=1 Tax=Punctularia strigosozonata (strain HHB-11173) TaxID=741275 RepID=UPI000441787C|nr:VAMP-associated protein [Punctularia strigosozonata HHB-11173 SS5]EIN12734.1 VAMP-associated protein [Punctularia strigosozonata HHB-11173 SS5]
MSVTLQPSTTLGFNRPLTQTVKRNLTVINHNDQPIAFKVKTTAPKLYSVRPNSGRIEPGESLDVQVMLQAMKEEPPLSAKCKDKFLIQSTFITPDKETLPLQEIWNSTDDSSEATKVHQHKIKVVYLPPEGQALEEEDETNMGSVLSGGEDSRQYTTVRQPSLNGRTQGIPDFSIEHEHIDDVIARSKTPAEDEHETRHPEPPSPIIQVTHADAAPVQPPSPVKPPMPIQSSVSSPSEEAYKELLQKYSEAQQELQRMRALLASMPDTSVAPTSEAPTLRRRTRRPSDAMTSTTMAGTYTGETETGYGGTEYTRTDYPETETGYAPTTTGTDVETVFSQSEGVPLQVVVAIAIGVFLTTYMFF